MNDFDLDIVERKRLARSARCKKNGSKSRRCTLPSDNLSPAQLDAMNSPVSSWSMSQPMSWSVFKAAPHDVQQSYIDAAQDRFGVSLSVMSAELFGLAKTSLRGYLVKNNLKYSVQRGVRLSKLARGFWEEWLAGDEAHDLDQSGDPAGEDGGVDMPQADCFAARSIAVEFAGPFDPYEFVKLLAQLPFPAGRVRIRVEAVEE